VDVQGGAKRPAVSTIKPGDVPAPVCMLPLQQQCHVRLEDIAGRRMCG
jgi:hypothetical protein